MYLRILLFSLFLISSNCLAWGSRGHNLITQVAVRLLNTPDYDSKMKKPFLLKEEMLGHLANIPDISWKFIDPEEVQLLNPTHYFEIDWLDAQMKLENVPQTIDALVERNKKNCAEQKKSCLGNLSKIELTKKIGSAPWRVQQFAQRMEASFRRIQSSPLSNIDSIPINDALDAAGLLSHFIGDLGNPHHVTQDFDGWESGHGGLHTYFEADLVDALDLGLIKEVYDEVVQKKPLEKKLFPLLPLNKRGDTLSIAIALALESRQRLEKLLQLDRDFARISASELKPKREKAKRRSPEDVAPHFKAFIIERLALAAEALAYIWSESWKKGKSPDLSSYFNLNYTLNPDPVLPEYLFH